MPEIARDTLVRALTQVRPALSRQDYVPAFTHFCFARGFVSAFNDNMLIRLQLADDAAEMPDCCVPGEQLAKTLSTLSAEKITVDHDPAALELTVTSGRTVFKLKTLPVKDFTMHVEKPEAEDAEWALTVDTDLAEGIKACRMATGDNPLHPASLGVTLGSVNGNAVLYSTDNQTITRYASGCAHDGEQEAILPAAFCDALISLTKTLPKAKTSLFFFPGAVMLGFIDKHGTAAIVLSKTLTKVAALDYERIMGKHCNLQKVRSIFTPLPDDFTAAFERVCTVVGDKPRATIAPANDRDLAIMALGAASQARDHISFSGKNVDEALEALEGPEDVDPLLIVRAAKHCDRIAFADKVVVFSDARQRLLHMIAYMAQPKKTKK